MPKTYIKHSFSLLLVLLPLAFGELYAQCIPKLVTHTNNRLCADTSLTLTAVVNLPSGCELSLGTPFQWTGPTVINPTSTNSITIPSASSGQYYVQVTINDNGSGNCPCVGQTPPSNIIVVQPCPPPPPAIPSAHTCYSGSATLTGTTSNGGELYWYDQAVGGTLLFIGNSFTTPPLSMSKTYYVTEVKDACESSSRTAVMVNATPLDPPIAQGNYEVCYGNSAILTVNTGGANGHFYWYSDIALNNLLHIGNDFTTTSLYNDTTYYVKEVLGRCSSAGLTINVTVNPLVDEPALLGLFAPPITHVCFGDSLTLFIANSGGTVHWYDKPEGDIIFTGAFYTTPPLTQTTTYWVQETNLSTSCSSNFVPITVTVFPQLLVKDTLNQSVQCFGGNDGSVALSTTGGTPPYTYHWDGALSSSTHTNLSSGMHSYRVTDDEGCVVERTINIKEPTELSIIPSHIVPSCDVNSQGQVSLVAFGGEAPYSFSTGGSGSRLEQVQLPVGIHTVQLTDGNGCVDSVIFAIPQTPLGLSSSLTPISCGGHNDGAIDVQITGGTLPYTYNWDDGGAGLNRSNLSANTYILSLTDIRGCTMVDTFVVDTLFLHDANLYIEGCPLVLAGDSNQYYPYIAHNASLSDSISWQITPNHSTHSYFSSQKDTLFIAFLSSADSTISLQLTNANDCDTVIVQHTIPIDTDPVLPGDIDKDGCLSNSDLLLLDHEVMLKFALHSSFYLGIIRTVCPEIHTPDDWDPEPAYAWNDYTVLNPSLNAKHLDVNGDGIVTSGSPYYLPQLFPPTNDLEQIMHLQHTSIMNTGTQMCHPQMASIRMQSNRDLLDKRMISKTKNGDTTKVKMELKLGYPNDSIAIKGIAFNTKIENGRKENLTFDYTNSHLGTPLTDMNVSNGRLSDSIAVSVLNRLDTRLFTGQALCELECYIFISPADRLANRLSSPLLIFDDVQVLDGAGNVIPIAPLTIPLDFSCGRDAFEPNDSLNAVVPLPLTGIRENAHICPPEDKDWYSFYVPPNKRHFRLKLSELSEDCSLSLFDTTGTLIINSDVVGPNDETIEMNFALPGKYLIEVKSSQEVSTTPYSLHIQKRNTPFSTHIKDTENSNIYLSTIQETAGLQKGTDIPNAAEATTQIYPNPTTGTFVLQHLAEDEIESVEVRIDNVNGQTIYNKRFAPTGLTFTQTINISQEASGIYFLTAKVNGRESHIKIIKE